MASEPITGLPAAAPLTGTDPLVTVQSGITVKSDVDAIKAFIDASPTMTFKGQADASAVDEEAATGTSIFQNGDVYRINVASAAPHAFSGISEDLLIGDWVVFNGTIFQKQDGTDPTAAETKTAYESNADTNAFTDAAQTKLGGIEALADVTDTANVDAAGAVMETDYNAQTVLLAVADDTPLSVIVAASSFVGRKAAGDVGTMTDAEARTVLNVEDGAQVNTVDDVFGRTGNVVAASSDYDASQIDNDSDVNGTFVDNALNRLLSEPWTLNHVISENDFSVFTQSEVPSGVFIRDDGLKMFVTDFAASDVFQYTLSTAWDVSTATYDSKSFSFSTQAATTHGVWFSTDGAKMFTISSSVPASFFEYDLGTAWDVSTAVYNSVTLDTSAQSINSRDLFFREDGLKLFLADAAAGSKVLQYTLTSAYDLSTASFDSIDFDVSAQSSSITDMFFKDDGLKMFVIDASSGELFQYTLGTAWDVSTASYDNVSYNTGSSNTNALFFKKHGATFFTINDSDDKIKAFEVAEQNNNPYTDDEKTKLAGISYAERTESAKQTITGSGALILAHNLPGIPTLWYVILENKETEHNFSPGDKTRPSAVQSSSNDQGVGIVPDGSDLIIRYGSGFGGGSSVFSVVDKTTGDVEIITNSKWEAIFVAAL